MRLSVASVLEILPVRDAAPEIVGGAAFLSREVRWVHTTDVTDLTGLLKGGELILTAGFMFTGSLSAARTYLGNVVGNGASGLMVSALAGWPGGDSVLREAAKDAELPVILLRDRVLFVELTEAVHRVLLGGNPSGEPQYRMALDVMDRLMLEEPTVEGLLELTAQVLRAPVVYEDADHRVIAFANASVPVERLLTAWREASRRLPVDPEDNKTSWMQALCSENGEAAGRLVVPQEVGDPLAPFVLERAAHLLGRWFESAGGPARPGSRAAGNVFWDLRHERLGDEHAALARAQAGGMTSAVGYVPLAVSLRKSHAATAADRAKAHEVLDGMHEAAHRAEVFLAAAVLSPTSIAGFFGIPTGGEHRNVLRSLLGGPEAAHSESGTRDRWLLAAAPVRERVSTAATKGVTEAMTIAAAASDLATAADGYYTEADVRLRRLLTSLRGDPHVREFVESNLAALKAEEPGYLDLLRRYIISNGNITELSRAVYLSRPSIYARLGRIEKVIGVSLGSAETRAALYVAMLADCSEEGEA